MGLCVTFVSGLRRSGKSAVIRSMIDLICKHRPHYIRLAKSGGEKNRPSAKPKPTNDCGLASARWLNYNEDRVFDVLPGALAQIYREDRFGTVMIEADADPVLRCAYPYDHRIFVMPVPEKVSEVFRDARHAAMELRRALDDTAAFASEIFGLFEQQDDEPPEDRVDLTETQMRGFLYSPLGDELATRIQIQPPYHGLVESDVIVVNTAVGSQGPQTEECLRRIDRLLNRLDRCGEPRGQLFHCNPRDHSGRDCKQLMAALKPMCAGGK